MQDNQFDKNVNDAFKDFEADPSARIWGNINHGIEEERKKRKRFIFWKFTGIVSLLLFIGTNLFWLTSNHDNNFAHIQNKKGTNSMPGQPAFQEKSDNNTLITETTHLPPDKEAKSDPFHPEEKNKFSEKTEVKIHSSKQKQNKKQHHLIPQTANNKQTDSNILSNNRTQKQSDVLVSVKNNNQIIEKEEALADANQFESQRKKVTEKNRDNQDNNVIENSKQEEILQQENDSSVINTTIGSGTVKQLASTVPLNNPVQYPVKEEVPAITIKDEGTTKTIENEQVDLSIVNKKENSIEKKTDNTSIKNDRKPEETAAVSFVEPSNKIVKDSLGKFHRFRAGVIFSPEYSYRTLTFSTKIFDNIESPKFSYNTGITATYDLTPKFRIVSGLQYYYRSQKTSSTIVQYKDSVAAYVTTSTGTFPTYSYNWDTNDNTNVTAANVVNINNGDTTKVAYKTNYHLVQSVSYVRIPIGLQYDIARINKIKLTVGSGLIVNYLLRQKTTIYNTTSQQVLENTSSSFLKKSYLAAYIHSWVTYDIAYMKQLFFGLEFHHGITPMNTDSGIKYYGYGIGFNTGVLLAF